MTLAAQFALILEEHRHSLAAPLSVRKVLLVAVLLDHFADRVFAQFRHTPERVFGAPDVLAWRATLAARSVGVELVGELASGRDDGALLRVDAITVPIADYPALAVEDYMVSLYNQNTVQRVVVVRRDGSTVLAHEILAAALDYWNKADWRG
ncbi:MAG: hypothetical protein JWP26_1672 [Devosia sp.]|uniref:hypothetical protein n=1 Tax=Devosia sp. TaxID=1871048 RepID=UPI00262FF7E8|nr:hypothetical protein [Devosia sp.]MDB5586702.1 hypothetical protein [Devosia sp.]